MGQVLKVNFEYDSPSPLAPLGEKNGYQHLYLEARGRPAAGNTRFSWMDNGRFYSLTSVADDNDELLFTRLGANDPEFNLRRDAALMIRRNTAGPTTFATTVEAHGSYSPVSELALNSNSNIAQLEIVYDDPDYTAVSIESLDGQKSLFVVSNSDAAGSTQHSIETGTKIIQWTGPYHYRE
jgi:hypothetical protein